ncbi:uncharacterized protein LOC131159088 [Malania oleifera]|uniref:uncharacterized protein LOC131159088 n=1 Tax=Malania oleifera TaxID=397392 RepID=UPI0025AE52CD|nr:uncharacterized protein LOC131159088 [Malania oleifera]
MVVSFESVVVTTLDTLGSGNSSLIAINVGSQLPLKLTLSNFPSWRAKLTSMLIGYDFQGYLDDKSILLAILAFVSKLVLSLIAASTTAHDAWSKLQQLYANSSRTSVMQLKEELTLIQQNSRSVSEYLQAIKVLVDELGMIDSSVSTDDIKLYDLNGVGPKYREIAAPIRARETSLRFEELHDMLAGHESYLRFVDASNVVLVALQAPLGTALSLPFSTAANILVLVPLLCDKVGHSTKTCYSTSGVKSVNCAATNASTDKKWLLDSAASNNITFNLANLFVHLEYDGTNGVVIGDGLGLRVIHVRFMSIPFPSKPLN